MRCLTLTLHPGLDRIVEVDRLDPGATLEARLRDIIPAGKGVNTARQLRRLLGRGVCAAAWVGRREAPAFAERLRGEGLRVLLCPRDAPTRQNVTVLESSGRETHWKETTAPPGPGEEAALLRFCARLPLRGSAVALCGSAPPGMKTSVLVRLLVQLRARAGCLVVDSSGPLLALAARCRPDGLKGNDAEIGAWLLGAGAVFDPRNAAHRAALHAYVACSAVGVAQASSLHRPRWADWPVRQAGSLRYKSGRCTHGAAPVHVTARARGAQTRGTEVLVTLGARGVHPLPLRERVASRCIGTPGEGSGAPTEVLVTLGARGVLLARADGMWWAEPPRVPERLMRSRTGCGDAATAGWLWALADGCGPEETVARALACGTAKLASPDPGGMDVAWMRRILARTRVRRIA